MILPSQMQNIMSSAIQAGQLGRPATSTLQLIPGQILSGQVLRILPDQAAIVRLNGVQIQARLEAAVTLGDRHWFQVLPTKQPISLKLIPIKRNASHHGEDFSSLLKWLGLKGGKEEEDILRYFMREKLPIKQESIIQVKSIIQDLGHSDQIWQSIRATIQKGWPLTENTTKAIYYFLQSSLIQKDIHEVTPYLQKEEQELLKQLFISPRDLQDNKSSLVQHFMKLLGIEDEALLKSLRIEPFLQEHWSLKRAISHHLQQNSALPQAIREAMERINSYILGQQLFLTTNPDHPQPILQYYFQLLFAEDHFLRKAHIQLEGRRTKSGEVDPDNCRLFFYLELSSLGDTCIDLAISNRIVSLTFYHHEEEHPYFKLYRPIIKQAFEEMDYMLSVYQWKRPSSLKGNERNPSTSASSYYQGMDILI